MDEQDKSGGFRVTDRRRFTETGAEREDPPSNDGPAPSSDPASPQSESEPAEPVTLSTFVLGLSTQALLLLGEIPDPESGTPARDLVGAKHMIDILGILKEKTRNNLEQAEEALLESVLYDLRMRYVELVRGAKKEGA
jgi:hypothetical protein